MKNLSYAKNLPLLLTLGLCALLALVLTSAELEAQVLYGTIVGNVKDASGAVVPGASVTATNVQTNQSREALTDATGAYSLVNVWPGTYTVKVTLTGFREHNETNVLVTNNNVTRVDATLQVGAASETVTVSGDTMRLQTDKTDVHKELVTKEITDLPVNVYRNYQSLIDLVPGTTPAAFQNAVIDTPARGLTTNVNGTARNSNTTRLDGATNVLTWLPHHVAYVAPQESVQTVSVSTNNFDAEQGLAGGAAITVQTKSGTNDLHGAAFEYLQNSALNAKNFFTPTNQNNPKLIRNMYGGAFGGPIKKDKLFYFVSYEAMRERRSYAAFYTVATPEMKDGDFSATGVKLYDPATGAADGSGRTEFVGAKIPKNRISPITSKMLALVPTPNQPGYVNNFYNSGPQEFDRDNYDFKVDWVKTTSLTIWGKYSLMNAQVLCKFGLADAGGTGLCSGGNGKGSTRVQLATIGGTWVITPKFIMDGTIGYTRYAHNTRGPDFGKNFGLDTLGIPGTNGPDIRQSGIPIFAITGYSTLGQLETWMPVDRKDNSYTYTANFSLNRGRHDFRWGIDVGRQHMNHWQPEIGGRGPRGHFAFTGGITALRGGASPNRFNSMADFLLGLPQNLGKSLQYFDPMSTREWLIGTYFRDRWQVSPKLTLTLGVRWEYYPLMTRTFTGIERYDPDDNKVYIGGQGGVPNNTGVEVSKSLFAPRVGIAYRVTDKDVLRLGYGITTDPYPTARPMRSPYPVVVSGDFEGPNSYQPYWSIDKGVPPIVGPDISKGIIDIPGTIFTRTIPKGELKRGYIQSWNLIYERQLPMGLVGSVGYVATRSIRQFALLDLNSAPAGGGTTGRELYKKFGRTAQTQQHTPFQSVLYDSMQATLDRRFTGGLMLKTAYTWSKAIGYQENSGEGTWIFMHPSVRYRQRSIQGYDRTHVFRQAAIWELPFGPGKSHLTSGPGAAILGGWQINGIFSAYSGTPFTVTASATSLNAPGNSQVADQVLPEVSKLGGIGLNNPWLDPLAFRPVTQVRWGNAGRNGLRGPGVGNVDLAVFRRFGLTEKLNMEFRAEAFNLTNTPHFANPSADASQMSFNSDGTLRSSGSFLAITSAADDSRNIRFGLRFSF